MSDQDTNNKQTASESAPKSVQKSKADANKSGTRKFFGRRKPRGGDQAKSLSKPISEKKPDKQPQEDQVSAPEATNKPAKKQSSNKPKSKTKRGIKSSSPKSNRTTPENGGGKAADIQKQQTPSPKQNQQAAGVTSQERQGLKLLINADEPEECRVALLEKGKLEAFHLETIVNVKNKGNIYKGKVVTVEPNLQAVFVDIGTGKNAFLPFSEIHPEYYSKEEDLDKHWKDLNLREIIHEGQELLVEVVKEATGNKGANVTTFLSLAGRYVVLMPGSSSHGISRKIEDETQRKRLRDMIASCKLPEGVGYIIRTASTDITKTALTKDVKFLINLWKEIKERGQTSPSPSLVHQEQDIVARFLRDHFSADIQEIVVDSEEAHIQVANFLELLPAAQRKKTTVKLHKGPRPLLNSFNVEEQIEQIYHPTVKLPSGGSIVISPTEALVAIDVNSGRTDRDSNFEKTIFQANMEAAEELARQLRLRDLGGLIVVDFIDMRVAAHTREVEKKLKTCMKNDKAKIDFTRISKFGLLQISRQRMAAPVQAGNCVTCRHCQGRGVVRSVETQSLVYLRQIQTGVTRKHVKTVQCLLPLEVGKYLLNKKRAELNELEKRHNTSIIIETEANLSSSQASIKFLKE